MGTPHRLTVIVVGAAFAALAFIPSTTAQSTSECAHVDGLPGIGAHVDPYGCYALVDEQAGKVIEVFDPDGTFAYVVQVSNWLGSEGSTYPGRAAGWTLGATSPETDWIFTNCSPSNNDYDPLDGDLDYASCQNGYHPENRPSLYPPPLPALPPEPCTGFIC